MLFPFFGMITLFPHFTVIWHAYNCCFVLFQFAIPQTKRALAKDRRFQEPEGLFCFTLYSELPRDFLHSRISQVYVLRLFQNKTNALPPLMHESLFEPLEFMKNINFHVYYYQSSYLPLYFIRYFVFNDYIFQNTKAYATTPFFMSYFLPFLFVYFLDNLFY